MLAMHLLAGQGAMHIMRRLRSAALMHHARPPLPTLPHPTTHADHALCCLCSCPVFLPQMPPAPRAVHACCTQGTTVVRLRSLVVVKHLEDGTPVTRERAEPTALHCDIIRDDFWKQHPHLLAP